MSGAVIFIAFCSQFHFSTQVEKTRKKVCLCANIYETEIWTASSLSEEIRFRRFFYEEAKNDKIGKSTPLSLLFKGLDNL